MSTQKSHDWILDTKSVTTKIKATEDEEHTSHNVNNIVSPAYALHVLKNAI